MPHYPPRLIFFGIRQLTIGLDIEGDLKQININKINKISLDLFRVRFLGSVYEAHGEAHRRSKTEVPKTEPLKTNLYKIYDRFTSPNAFLV